MMGIEEEVIVPGRKILSYTGALDDAVVGKTGASAFDPLS